MGRKADVLISGHPVVTLRGHLMREEKMPTDTLEALIARVTFTKTNYIEAHEYIVASRSADCAALHDAVAHRIATEGYERSFQGVTYRYVNIGGYRYWTMRGGILNRALLPKEEAHARQG
jgi:hypothetical protein